MDTNLILRRATMDDAKILLDWRNDVETRAFSLHHNAITWNEHVAWLSRSLKNLNRILCIAEISGNPIGTVRADRNQDSSFEISYTIAPLSRGKGMGKKMVLQFADEVLAGCRITAKIKRGNISSENIARALGLHPLHSDEPSAKDTSKDTQIVKWQ